MTLALKATLAVWCFALGLAVGSFLNVCIYRLPRGLAVTGRSHCPSCGATLGLLDLIPLFSQLALRARCRHCWARFSWRYFGVELLCGLLYLGTFLYITATRGLDVPALARLLIVFPCLVAVILIDFETYTIPDGLHIAMAVAGLGYDIALRAMGSAEFAPVAVPLPGGGELPILRSVLGAMVGFGGLWLIGRVFSGILGEEAMGYGDVKFLGAAGTLLGPGVLLLAFFVLAVALGALAGIGALVGRRWLGGGDSEHRVSRTRLPFGPFLAAALAVALVAPEQVEGVFSALYSLAGAGSVDAGL